MGGGGQKQFASVKADSFQEEKTPFLFSHPGKQIGVTKAVSFLVENVLVFPRTPYGTS